MFFKKLKGIIGGKERDSGPSDLSVLEGHCNSYVSELLEKYPGQIDGLERDYSGDNLAIVAFNVNGVKQIYQLTLNKNDPTQLVITSLNPQS